MRSIFLALKKKFVLKGEQRSYWIFAFVEFVLIILGILIALQIDNRNENRKDRITELSILEELIQELSSDVGTLKYNIDKHEKAKESCEIILKIIEEDGEYTDSLAKHFAATHYYTVSFSKRGAYESLKSLGFRIISNKDLRFRLIDLYEQWFMIVRVNQEILSNEIQNLKRNFNQHHFKQFKIFDVENPQNLYAGQMVPTDFSSLKQSEQYNYYLNSLYESHSFFLFQMSYTIDLIDGLINELNNQLDYLK